MTNAPTAPAFDEHTPVKEVERAIPDDFLAYLDSIGSERSRRKWEIGDLCILLIDGGKLSDGTQLPKFPAMQIYEIVGKRVDYSVESVRKLVATSRYYSPETRACYENLHHSVFQYARTCAFPEQVLQAALQGQQTMAVVKNTNKPILEDLRDTYSRVKKEHRDEANAIVKTALAKLRELAE